MDLSTFAKEYKDHNITLIGDIFTDDYFAHLKNEALGLITYNNRNETFSGIRKAGTISSSKLSANPTIHSLYTSPEFIGFLKEITGLDLERVNCDDKSSMNLLVYEKTGDFISWHKDPNHYKGNRITVLINIVNESCSDPTQLSESFLQYKLDGSIVSVKMKPNSILVFNGSIVDHRATGIGPNERRIQLSFTYCDVCRETFVGKPVRWLKETVLGY
ncbi:hypothetical protein EB118_06985 [bacterium]|nr:hypothetical protein [bacterium]NDC94389.1 hypothetical protein [bacterium]NDD83930.1 hypothetical protein [bacterium]NDG29825.1 hypothetical protein [bacterium]